jgi:hypothetical protein
VTYLSGECVTLKIDNLTLDNQPSKLCNPTQATPNTVANSVTVSSVRLSMHTTFNSRITADRGIDTMTKIQYKAQIEYTAIEDNYDDGEIGDFVNNWHEDIIRDSREMLKQAVIEATYQSDFSTIDDDQMNNYEWCTEYQTSYLANGENEGEATSSEIEAWKKGKLTLYAINCHILVTKITEAKGKL